MFMIVTVKVRGTNGLTKIRHMCKKHKKGKTQSMRQKQKRVQRALNSSLIIGIQLKFAQQGMTAK